MGGATAGTASQRGSAAPARPPRPGLMAGRAFSFWLVNYRRNWFGSAISSFLAPVLFLASMGFGLGALVDAGPGGPAMGVAYVAFVAPGVLAATAMQTGVGESTFPVMAAVKWQRQYHAMLATPLTVVDVLLGHMAFIAVRILATAAVFLAVATLLGAVLSPWALLALPAALLCGLAHAAPVFAFSATQERDTGFMLLFRLVVTPLFLFSGTFFPARDLPPVLEQLAYATPLWHGVDLCRQLSLGTPEAGPAALHVAYLLLWFLGGLLVARRTLTRRLQR
ncbi:lipooligosaccharide transport system permease protein [Kineococcus xinjiangensis]|uniref:Transport permease protein n=1 Tax=Kineococcus xinjiangensis TaxID=512762 RepID=A0A2S6IVU5_9ACTN|nr:ABC transporter permease [Kineococcus xinjiangensis]PPK98468.1 lipooligosaccharide transport system permease protein [Kineococcus xinjiangensis]